MSVTQDDIKKVAKLARIEIPEESRADLAKQVGGIMEWINKLEQADTDGVEPLINVHEATLSMSKDEVSDGDKAEEILANSKDSKYGYFTVPKVIE